MNITAEHIKRTCSLENELSRYGISADKKGFANCPFHDERTASFKIYPDGTYHCFGCGAHGDVITFTMKIQNVSFKEACSFLSEGRIRYSEMRRADKAARIRRRKEEERAELKKQYWSAFDDWKLNEDIIEGFKPDSPDGTPSIFWLGALSQRAKFTYRLERAESRLRNFGKGAAA